MTWVTIAGGEYDDDSVVNETFLSRVRGNLYHLLYPGWHGYESRIKLLPSDFITDTDADPQYITSQTSGAGAGTGAFYGLITTVAIPKGYKATAVMIYATDAGDDIVVYQCNLSTTTTNKGNGSVNVELDITDVSGGDDVYLSIYVADDNDGANFEITGGYITIEWEGV